MVEKPTFVAGMEPSLMTERLRLHAFELGDAAELHEIFSDPATFTIGSGPFRHLDQTQAWIQRRMETCRELGLCWYGLRQISTGRLIGNCGIFIGRTGTTEPEIGYMIRRDCQGLGYASEAAAAVISEHGRVRPGRVWATVRPSNRDSRRVLEKIGMKLDHCEEDHKGPLLFLSRTFNADSRESYVDDAGMKHDVDDTATFMVKDLAPE